MEKPTRRSLLGALFPPTGFSPAAGEGIRVGAHPWVYAAPRPNHDIYGMLDEIFADMAWAGMDFIELMHTALEPDEAVSRIRELSAQHKLPVIGSSYGADMWRREEHSRILEYADRFTERLAQVGGRLVGVSVGNARRRKTEAELDAQAELLARLERMCRDRGITLNLHNHTYEVENDEHDLKGTLARLPDIKLGPDIDWLVGAGVDPVGFIRRHRGRIVYAHLRDRRSDGVWSEAMGEGSIDYRAVAEALRETGFRGALAIELAHPRDFRPTRPLRESLKISRRYVRRVMGY